MRRLAFATLFGTGSIQGPDRYHANLEEPPLLHTCYFCVVGSAPVVPISPPDRPGDRGGSAEKSAMKGDYSVLQDAPKLGGSSLWAPKPVISVSHSGPPIQRAISGTTGQVGSSETGSQDYPSFLFRKSECSALFLHF